MIKHVVMWNLKDEALGKSKEENAAEIKKILEALDGVIEEIKYIEVGINDKDYAPSNYDVVLISEFESFDGLRAYNVHPKHQEVGKFIKQVVDARTAVDFEF